MLEILASVWISTLFLLKSPLFLISVAIGFALSWAFALVISRLRLNSGDSPVDAAYTGVILGSWVSALAITLFLWFYWRPDYVLVALVIIIMVFIPWLVLFLVKRNETLTEA